MNVGILVKEFPPDVIAGTETQTLRMARELQERTDHDVTVYTKAYPGPEEHGDEPFDLVRIPNWRRSPFLSTLTFVLFSFVYVLRDARKLDVLQCMMIYPCGFVGYLVSLLTGLPYFAWIRGGDFYFAKENPVKRWLMQRVFDDALVLVQADTVRRDVLAEFPDAELSVLGNGVDLPDQRAAGDSVVFVGRLKGQKGADVLLRAMDGVDERLVVVGDGPERESLEALAADLDVDAAFVGEVEPEAVGDYLRDGQVYVLPAVAGEGLPNAMLEAMAVGLPVVATDIAGIPDVVADGENGYVVDPGDEDALRERIETVCSDDAIRTRLGENARTYVEDHHSWDAMVDRLDRLYRRVREGR
ncbi:glycosyltransferase family 4 protein [Haloarculaceae archaeon H-GB2-1]|nr:glycosyltransferase family 4 protein [Haloarculaceae archaeon H-GB1-1]MEA5386497.1 glycosyltransferase family 4 protein [Haloarculaceae archaeon H-GB11]MEA5408010.1 glycosyltransferase family 4 protein [Haloarculaceae archaeon H-GB2-1]